MGSGTSGKGSSSSRSSSTTNNVTTTHVDNRVYQSDFGAVEAGTGVANRAVDALTDISSDALDLGRDGLAAGTDNLNLGLGFAEKVYGDSLAFGGDAIDAIASNSDSALDFGRDALGRLADNQDSALDFLSNLVDSFGMNAQKFTDQAIAGFETLAVKSSESADDRVGKVAIWAFVAVAAIMIVPAFARK